MGVRLVSCRSVARRPAPSRGGGPRLGARGSRFLGMRETGISDVSAVACSECRGARRITSTDPDYTVNASGQLSSNEL
jgi:hypothetical protein